MLNGLDLFSGIGGISLALKPWVRPIAYCENDRYCHAVLLSRMRSGEICRAPIWDDISTLRGSMLPRHGGIDIIYGGFPCQDVSSAGRRAGLNGKRSGLFYEITRLAKELRPSFVFLENVAKGIGRYEQAIADEFDSIGYTARATTVSAFDVGANHERLRWFCLAYPNGLDVWEQHGRGFWAQGEETERHKLTAWWTREPGVPGVVDGVPFRMDRARALGNAVVPLQAREAFMRLSGLRNDHA